jgi:hypothetical protein
MRSGIRGLPVSRAALLRLLGAVAVVATVAMMGEDRVAAHDDCYFHSLGCYGEGCKPGWRGTPYNFTYGIMNWHCYPEWGDDYCEAQIPGCCLDVVE